MFVVIFIIIVFKSHYSSFKDVSALLCLFIPRPSRTYFQCTGLLQASLGYFDARLEKMGRGDLCFSKQFLRMHNWYTHDSYHCVFRVFLCFDVWVS